MVRTKSNLRCAAIRGMGLLSLAFVISLSGCVGAAVKKEELPETLIALSYWDSEAGRRRKEALGEAPRKTPMLYRDGVAELGAIESMFSGENRGDVDTRWPSRLMLLNPRTLELTRVPEAPPGARPLSWSDDHQRLLFTTDRMTGLYQVFELDMLTRDVRPVTTGSSQHVAGAFGPNGAYVVARVSRGPSKQVTASIMVNRNKGLFKAVADNVAVRQIDYAPDGSAIVYVPRSLGDDADTNRGMRSIVTVKEPKASAPAKPIGAGVHPTFTHDGKWIVYTAPYKDRSYLRRVRPDGTGRAPIGKSVRDEKAPAVSPDSKFVVYISEHNGADRLFVKRFDGTGDRMLFDNGVVAWPVW